MASVKFNDALKSEYQKLLAACTVRPERVAVADHQVDLIMSGKRREEYDAAAAATGVPFFVIGIIHFLETGGRLDRHLHNGDPIDKRTVHVPAGRPKKGNPPFDFHESAIDALEMKMDWTDWSLEGICYYLEAFNGFGYRNHHPHVKSPYLWSFTNIYVAGKYVADHKWSDTAVSQQCGGVTMLKRMAERGLINFDWPGAEADQSDDPSPAIVPVPWPGVLLRIGSIGSNVRKVQLALVDNGMKDFGSIDGEYGERTADAVRLFQSRHDAPDGTPLEIDGVVGPMTWAALFGTPSGTDEVDGDTASVGDIAARALAFAKSQLGVVEQPKGSNRGPEIDQYHAAAKSDTGQPWCMAFVVWCFAQAAAEAGVAIPLPRTAGVLHSWDRARKEGLGAILTAADAAREPDRVRPGMVFYIKTGAGTGHTGFVAGIHGGKLITVEGNTNPGGSREGYGVFQRTKRSVESINLGFIAY